MLRAGWKPALEGCRNLILMLVVLLPASLFAARSVYAIPAFARKYQTSCATCHVAPPALTPFGEAFRLNGYRFPAGMDEEMTKVPPVPLGAEGYKKLWPKALWPGTIPGMPPVAVVYTSTIDYSHPDKAVTFQGMGGELEIFGAGTLDEHLSFWGSVDFARNGADVEGIETAMERVNLQVRPLSGPELQFKVGSFEPGLMLVSTHRSIFDQELMVLTAPAGDNPWAPEGFQQGLEGFGVIQHRLLYNAGVVEGSGSIGDASKDVYGRVAYKFGGLPFDGVTKGGAEAAMPGGTKPWSETSLAISGFAYRGKSFLGDATNPDDPHDKFRLYGTDVAVNYHDLMGHAGYVHRKDDQLFIDDPAATNVPTKDKFAELTWVTYPWLIPAARWESYKVDDGDTQQISLTITGLARANVKTFLAADWVKDPGGKYVNEGGTLGVLMGF